MEEGRFPFGPIPAGAIQGGYIPPGAIKPGELQVGDLAKYVGFPDAAAYLRHLGLPEDATIDDVAMRMLGFPYGPSTDDLIAELEAQRPPTLRERISRLLRRAS